MNVSHDHRETNQAEKGHDMGDMGMGHGSGWRGMFMMLLCCLPMIAIALLLVFGVLK